MPTEQLEAPAIRTCQSQAGPYLLTDIGLPAALPLIIIFNSVLGLVYSPWLNQGCTIAVLLSAVNKGVCATGPSKGTEAVEILFGGLLEPETLANLLEDGQVTPIVGLAGVGPVSLGRST